VAGLAACVLVGLAGAAWAGPPVVLPAVALQSSAGTPEPDTLPRIDDALTDALRPAGVAPLRFPVDAPPRPPDDTGAELRRRAEEATALGDTAQATRAYRQLIDHLLDALAAHGDVEPLTSARLALAGLYLGVGEAALARSELDAAARVRPAAELDPRVWSPVVIEAFDEARRRVAAEPTATLSVTTTPAGAEVVIDGVPRGVTPTSVTLPRGPHLVQLARAGHTPVVRRVVLEPGGQLRRDEQLQPTAAFSAWSAATATLRAPGSRGGDVAALVSLRRALDAEVLWVPVAVSTGDGVAVVVARVVDDVEVLAWAGLGVDATPASVALLARLVGAAVSTTAPPETGPVVLAEHLAGQCDPRLVLRVDPRARALGVADGVAVVAPVLESDAGPWTSPWTWVAVGVGGAFVAGAATAAVVLLQPEPVEQRQPDRTRIVLEVLP
jgi:hypothetical protein